MEVSKPPQPRNSKATLGSDYSVVSSLFTLLFELGSIDMIGVSSVLPLCCFLLSTAVASATLGSTGKPNKKTVATFRINLYLYHYSTKLLVSPLNIIQLCSSLNPQSLLAFGISSTGISFRASSLAQ